MAASAAACSSLRSGRAGDAAVAAMAARQARAGAAPGGAPAGCRRACADPVAARPAPVRRRRAGNRPRRSRSTRATRLPAAAAPTRPLPGAAARPVPVARRQPAARRCRARRGGPKARAPSCLAAVIAHMRSPVDPPRPNNGGSPRPPTGQPSQSRRRVRSCTRNLGCASRKSRKCMIGKDFSTCPRNLWITLWGNCGKARQVLDFACRGIHCPIWWHAANLLQINDLVRIDEKTRGPTIRSASAQSQHVCWG